MTASGATVPKVMSSAELAKESNMVHDRRTELMNKLERLRKASLEFDVLEIHC
jgi:hypothetical protein